MKTPEEAFKAAQKIIDGGEGNSFTDVVVKAQVHSGGRGKGVFKENNFHGGVQIANSAEDAKMYAERMLGKSLVTK